MATRVAILIERDPDGDTYVALSVDGKYVQIGDATVVDVDAALTIVDAGAGHDGTDWFDGVKERVQAAIEHDGPEFGAAVLDAYRNPPGREYVTEFDLARVRFDADTAEFAGLREN